MKANPHELEAQKHLCRAPCVSLPTQLRAGRSLQDAALVFTWVLLLLQAEIQTSSFQSRSVCTEHGFCWPEGFGPWKRNEKLKLAFGWQTKGTLGAALKAWDLRSISAFFNGFVSLNFKTSIQTKDEDKQVGNLTLGLFWCTYSYLHASNTSYGPLPGRLTGLQDLHSDPF